MRELHDPKEYVLFPMRTAPYQPGNKGNTYIQAEMVFQLKPKCETQSDLQLYLKVNITNLDTMELNVIHRQRLQMAKVKGNNKLRESN